MHLDTNGEFWLKYVYACNVCMIQNGSYFKEPQTLVKERKTSFYIIWVTAHSTS